LKLKIVGSGGMYPIPSPFCKCKICDEAREKRGLFERCEPSIYVVDIKLLIDTPEDIAQACDKGKVYDVDYLSISHKDPDHVRGIRNVVESRFDWIKGEVTKPIKFFALPEVIDGINQREGNTLDFYADILKIIEVTSADSITIDNIKITMVNNEAKTGDIAFYVLEEGDKKVVYACCNTKPFKDNEVYRDTDILIIGMVSDDGILKDGTRLCDVPIKDEIFTIDEIHNLKKQYNIKKVIVTHIDDIWGKSYEEYKEIEKSLDGIEFAYDGMEIEV